METRPATRRLRRACWGALALLTCASSAALAQDQETTLPPRGCELASIKVRFHEGWYPIQLDKAPVDKEGCLLLRIMPDRSLGGIIRLTSTGTRLLRDGEDEASQLLETVRAELKEMHHLELGQLAKENRDARVAPASGFTHAMVFQYPATIPGNAVQQQVWIALIMGADHDVTVALVSPNEREFPEYWKANKAAFQTVLVSLQAVRHQP